MNMLLTWSLAIAALVVGYRYYGWQGVVFAMSLIAFWMLLQFSRLMRVMTVAGKSPIGQVADARSLGLRLRMGQPLVDVLKLTKSLGERIAYDPETFRWTDANGDSVQVVFVDGCASSWSLQRHDAAADDAATA
jgi:hypothetical protein